MGVLRKWFGPSKQEIWQQLADELGHRYVKDGHFGAEKIQAEHGEWTITLDVYNQVISTGKTMTVIPYTRMRAPYINRDDFRFEIYRRGFFSDIAKWLGGQDVEVGHEPFDEDFVIKGNDTFKLMSLFADEQIRDLLAAQPKVYFSVKDDEGWFGPQFEGGVDELHFCVEGEIKDTDSLKALFDLFAETLDQLCLIGSAYESDPGVEL